MPSYVVTGAARGIGLEFVRQLSNDASNTVFALVRTKANAQAVIDLQSKLTNVHVIESDITDVAALKAAASEVGRITGGTLDVLINNAALVNTERSEYTLDAYIGKEDLLEKDFIDAFKVDVLGTIYTTNIFLPLLQKASSTTTAKVITISTGFADLDATLTIGEPAFTAYSINKAGLNMAVAKYATRFKDDNIVFLALSPGFVNTAIKPPTEEELGRIKLMMERFQKAQPSWNGQALTPTQSVEAQLEVIAKVTTKDSGSFISHHGNKVWL